MILEMDNAVASTSTPISKGGEEWPHRSLSGTKDSSASRKASYSLGMLPRRLNWDHDQSTKAFRCSKSQTPLVMSC